MGAVHNTELRRRALRLEHPLVPEDFGLTSAPVLPAEPPKPSGGCSRIPDRAAYAGFGDAELENLF